MFLIDSCINLQRSMYDNKLQYLSHIESSEDFARLSTVAYPHYTFVNIKYIHL